MSPRDRILARRAKFIAAAIAASGAAGCADVAEDPAPTVDAAPEACLSADATFDTGMPEPCLGATPDDTGTLDGSTDTAPMPCLDPAPEDAAVDTGPEPCLKMPPPDAG